MLVKEGNITVSVLHFGKEDHFRCTIYVGDEKKTELHVKLGDWDSDHNDLRSYMINAHMADLWKRINDMNTDHVDSILAHVRSVKDYGVKSGADIDIDGDIFRLDKDGYISSKAFQIWYIGVKHRIPAITDPQWKEFVAACLDIADREVHDPLGPDIVDTLIDTIKMGEIHDRRDCDILANEVMSHGNAYYFVYLRNEDHCLLVPKHITESIRKQQNIGVKKARQYWQPFLLDPPEDNIRVGKMKYEDRPAKRFWRFSMEKLVDYDRTLSVIFSEDSEHIIECGLKHVEVLNGK